MSYTRPRDVELVRIHVECTCPYCHKPLEFTIRNGQSGLLCKCGALVETSNVPQYVTFTRPTCAPAKAPPVYAGIPHVSEREIPYGDIDELTKSITEPWGWP